MAWVGMGWDGMGDYNGISIIACIEPNLLCPIPTWPLSFNLPKSSFLSLYFYHAAECSNSTSFANVLSIISSIPSLRFQKKMVVEVPTLCHAPEHFLLPAKVLYPEYKAARPYFGRLESMPRPILQYYRSIPISYV